MEEVQKHYRTCNICEAMCGIVIEHRGKEILSIKGDKDDPLSQGHICPKAVALQDFHNDPDRLRRPIKKNDAGEWEEISWEEAISFAADGLKRIQEKHGKNAVATFLGNPNAHNLGNSLFMPIMLRALGSRNRFSASSVDQLPHHVVANYMYGHGLLTPIPDIDRTDFMMILGYNPMVSNGSMMTVPNFPRRLRAIQDRGGKFVVIDPRRTETADKADEHLFIRPETDALFLGAILYTIFESGDIRLRHLGDHVKHLDILRDAVQSLSPEKVGPITGIDAQDIRRLTRELMAAKSAAIHSRMGASTQSFGGLCQWFTHAINIISGNFDREGGVMFTQPAADHIMARSKKGKPRSYGKYSSRVSGKPYFNGEFPVGVMIEEIETPGEDQVKAMFICAGNPVLSTPNGLRVEKALKKLEFLVSVDIYKTETNRHADIILPVATGLAADNFDIVFHANAVRNTAKYYPALFPRDEDQRYDWEVLRDLTNALLGIPDSGMTPEMMLDMLLRGGKYADQGLSVEMLKDHPHGIDLGPLQPCILQRLQSDDDLIDLAPELFVADVPRLEKCFLQNDNSSSGEYPFALIGRRSHRHHNTWTHNVERLMRGRNQCTLLIHPNDARQLNVQDGEEVEVESKVGAVTIEAEISDEVMPGVVSIPQGWGSRKGTSMSLAASYGGVSINDLTDETRMDDLTGNSALNGVGVRIRALVSS